MNNKTLKHIIEARFRIVTPMFLGGADRQAEEIRPASVKGMLRFWWRALQWQQFRGNAGTDEKALRLLHTEEARLFGSAVNRDTGGQGVFLLRISHPSKNLKKTDKDKQHIFFLPTQSSGNNSTFVDENHLAGTRYLGYGLVVAFSSKKQGTKAGQLLRACINENQFFSIQLLFRKEIDQSILKAIKIIGLLGGMGSRTRRGIGSIALETLTSDGNLLWKAPADCQQYIAEITNLLSDLKHIPESPYSAFSGASRIDLLLKGNSASEVLEQYGLRMLDYRSWGRTANNNKLPSGKTSEMRFKNDHDWSKDPFSQDFIGYHPNRVIFGLPHTYGKLTIKSEHFERRSSPLMFHVHQLDENKYVGVSVLLHSQFLPENEHMSLPSRKRNETNLVKANVNYQYLHDFLNGHVGSPPRSDLRFPDRNTIFP